MDLAMGHRRWVGRRALGPTTLLAGSLALLAPAAARATISAIPDGDGGTIACSAQAGENAGERHCSGIFTTFDGSPIDVNVGFPPAPGGASDGGFPVVGVFHGWGGSKLSLTGDGLQQWLDDGYAVFSMSDRGWGMSCGAADPKRVQPVCADGYNHLMDTRYEVRDAQEVFEALADAEPDGGPAGRGLIDPKAIGATGGSYGGGISMALGALRNRKMMGGESPDPIDGTLVPWVSDGGKEMQIAAVQPDIPWTDLAYSLQPNGATLDYVADAPYLGPEGDRRIGVEKQSFVALLYAAGLALSNYAAPGTDPDADLTTWFGLIGAGEPYDDNPAAGEIVEELTRHHSSYYIDASVPPAPMLISNGWTDDLFPPDEAIRFYNRTRSEHPETPIALIFTDHGHQRGQNKDPDSDFRNAQLHAWFDHYVKGEGPAPFVGVQTLTQTCPGSAPSGGADGPFEDASADRPFSAADWNAISPGEVRLEGPGAQTVTPGAGDPLASASFDPVGGGGACASAGAGDAAGTASYRLDPAPAGGFTLMGSPTVIADIASPGATSQLAARLLDVSPDGSSETLVARGLWRPEVGSEPVQQVFQLHPNGWHFAEGHVAKLELLPADPPYGRVSNGQASIDVSALELRVPVAEEPGSGGGVVEPPAPPVLPPGYVIAPGFDDANLCGGAKLQSGTAGRDKLRGSPGPDAIRGRGGADRLRGRGGPDCLRGEGGRDTLAGGGGRDTLTGGPQGDVIRARDGKRDRVRCGPGKDLAVTDGADSTRGCERVRAR